MCVCVLRGVGLSAWDVFTGCGKSRPPQLPARDRLAAGPVLPPSSKLPAAKQIKRNTSPPRLCQLENDRPGHFAQRPFTINGN